MTHLEAIARILNSAAFDQRGMEKARAILTAIRDPTPAMLKAGGEVMNDSDDPYVDTIWVSMVDAALAETST